VSLTTDREVEPNSDLPIEICEGESKFSNRFTPTDVAQDDVSGRRMLGLVPFEVLLRETVGGVKVIEEASRILAITA